MLSLLLTLAIYTLIILVFVPLNKIAKAQDWVKLKIKEIKNKVQD